MEVVDEPDKRCNRRKEFGRVDEHPDHSTLISSSLLWGVVVVRQAARQIPMGGSSSDFGLRAQIPNRMIDIPPSKKTQLR